MKKSFFLSAFLVYALYSSQKINLNWDGTEAVQYATQEIKYPKFGNTGYQIEGNMVYYNIVEKSNGKRFSVKNLSWQKISKREIFGLDEQSLPTNDDFGVAYFVSPLYNEEVYNLRIATLKFENGSIYRLSSFEIIPENDIAFSQKNKTFSTNNTINTENPLKSGTFYKIKIDQSGVFKITKKFLQDNGINVANINPKNFRIYGNGGLVLPEDNRDFRYPTLQENAIQVVGEEDGVWNDSDYALFYAQGANGFNLYGNTNGNTRKDNRTDRSRHTINIYEDASYYFINFDLGEGKRIASKNTALPEGDLFTRYDDYQFINEEKNNLIKLGRVWVGDAFTNDIAVKFTTKTPLRSDDIVNYRTSFVGYKSDKNSLSLSINGQAKGTTILSDGYRKSNYFTGSLSNLTGNEVSFNFSPNISANPAGTFHLDYVEIMYPQDLVFNGSQMNFRSYEITENDNETYGFSMANASSVEQIWEVSDITNVYRMTNKSADNTTFNFGYEANSAQFNNEFVAFNHSAAYTPTFVGRIDNQDISSLQNIDYLVITRQDMMSEAARLTSYHETKNGFRTAIVSTEQIYNEFSSGKKDITAIRDFISHLKNNRGGLRYVLILGDTSYDYKDKTTGNDNIVPSYQSEESGNYSTSFVTDDYFVMTNPQTTSSIISNLPTLPIGRLPASNLTEAKLLIDKTLAYYNALPNQSSPFGAWRMNLDFVADDNNEGGTPFHTIMNDAIAENFETGTERKEYHTRKLYMDAYQAETTAGGQRFPQINQSIANAVGNSLYLFYFGHGGINGWAQERILTLDEIQKFNNYSSIFSRFPLVSTITCEFTLWDEPLVQSAGEQVIKQKNGGAATMITSSREIGVTYGKDMTDIFTKNIFALQNNDFATLGDAFLNAKKEKGTHSDHLRVNYLGDPAMKLSRPKPLLTIDNIQTPVAGKIRALDFVKIEGSVLKEDGSVNTDFNGNVSINIFDKKLTKSTLNNDGNLTPILTFNEEGSAVVKSSGKAENGKYSVEFYMPKDINYTLGDGRILVYADNFETAKTNAIDVYANQNYTIGEINENGINDSEAPKVNLYMNNTNFANGGITNQNPTFLACVTDDTGINSAGSGVGHDITVMLDGKVINTIVLNDFYNSGEGNGCINPSLKDYQKGSVLYPFRNLSVGEHQLTFKVWDINNNSTTSSLNFIVKDESEQKLELNRLLNWPNPFTNKTYIHFEHNCDDILDVNVQIFTITGKLVRTLSTSISSDPFMQGYRTPKYAIEWDGRDDFGDMVGKGTYIYKVFAKAQNQNQCKGSATAVEKMVVLK